MRCPLKPLAALLACAVALTGIGSPLTPASPFAASVASAAGPVSATPTKAAAKPSADPLQPFVVDLEGPADGTGGFMVFVTKPSSGIARAKHNLPTGATFAELTDNSGRTVWVFINPKPGRYEFNLSVQLPLGISAENPTGQDPFAEDSLVVVVGGVAPPVVPPAVPPVVDPTKPVEPPAVDPATTPMAAIYVYEKDETAVPSAVRSALNRLNRERKILATEFEDDTIDDSGSTPAQYTIPLAAARKAGLPALVVMAGSEVLSVTLAPTTEEQVLEAVK